MHLNICSGVALLAVAQKQVRTFLVFHRRAVNKQVTRRVSERCRIVYKRNDYIMHISGDFPENNRPTEAGGLGLCVDGTTCLHTYTVYICIMFPFYIWH